MRKKHGRKQSVLLALVASVALIVAAPAGAYADPGDDDPQPSPSGPSSDVTESPVDAVAREIAEIDAQVADFAREAAMSEVALEQAKQMQQALLAAIAAQEDLIAQLQLGLVHLVNTENQDPGLGAALTFMVSDSPESFLRELATREATTRLLEERAARFNSEQARLVEMKADHEEQTKAIEAEVERRRELEEAQRRAAAAAAAAISRLSPEDLEALHGRIEASGGVLPFTRPVGGRISLRFGTIDGLHGTGHSGTDFANSCGTPVVASAAGSVTRAGVYGWEGYYIEMDHGRAGDTADYYRTGYAHLLAGSILVTPGQFVERGQVIASVGNTGYSFGCHLHWMVWRNGSLTDGYYYIPDGMA